MEETGGHCWWWSRPHRGHAPFRHFASRVSVETPLNSNWMPRNPLASIIAARETNSAQRHLYVDGHSRLLLILGLLARLTTVDLRLFLGPTRELG